MQENVLRNKIKEKIQEMKRLKELANEEIENEIVIVDSDSYNAGLKEAHNYDIWLFEELLKGE